MCVSRCGCAVVDEGFHTSFVPRGFLMSSVCVDPSHTHVYGTYTVWHYGAFS